MRPIRLSLPTRPAQRAFTLIELMVVIALIGIILMLTAPNMTEMIGMQRLRAINDQLITDFQYLRGEAVSRNQFMGLVARSVPGESMSCYVIFSNSAAPLASDLLIAEQCNCSNAVGAACAGTHRELRTVQIPRSFSIDLRFPPGQGNPPETKQLVVASPINGGMFVAAPDTLIFTDLDFCIEVRRSPRGRLRTSVNIAGRASACSPDSSVPGVPACPAYVPALGNCKPAI